MKRAIFPLCLLALSVGLLLSARAQETPETEQQPDEFARLLQFDRGAAGLQQTLRRLRTRASMLMVTAHPDDEDSALLTLQSRGRGARTMLLTLTRGEGGANVMSNDFFDALGLVRTQELLAAGRYYGIHQYWSRAVDYGFSKTREEAFDEWGYDRILYDAVRVVRMTRPLVLTSVFIGGPTDGHGNHQTTGQLTQEIFNMAGDPTVFPEQLAEGLQPWKPLKVYGRVPSSLQEGNLDERGVYNYASQSWSPAGYQNYVEDTWTEGSMPTHVEAESGDYDPVLGWNYQQVARQGLGLQKCQLGGPAIPPAGRASTPYHRFGSRSETSSRENSFYDGIDVSLPGIAELAPEGDRAFLVRGLSEIDADIVRAGRLFAIEDPSASASALADGLKRLRRLIDTVSEADLSENARYDVLFELKVKERQFQEAIEQALGLSLLAVVTPDLEEAGSLSRFRGIPETFQLAVADQEFPVAVWMTNQSPRTVQLESVELKVAEDSDWSIEAVGPAPAELPPNQRQLIGFQVRVSSDPTLTRPYFSRPGLEQAYYDLHDPEYLNLSHRPYPLSVQARLRFEGVMVQLRESVHTVDRRTGLGTVLNPLAVGPPISLTVTPRRGVVPLDRESFELQVALRSNVKGPARGSLRLDLPEGWRSEPPDATFETARDGEVQTRLFRIFPDRLTSRRYRVEAVAEYQGRMYREGYRIVGYEGLRPDRLYRPADWNGAGVDVEVAEDLSVAYVMGTGDDVPEALENLGVEVAFLSEQELATGDLSRYDLILLGVRTYAARPELESYTGRLLEYVHDGGVVVVQYNTPEFDENFGPYPYTMTRSPEEVTDEKSGVRILLPEHPLFNWPNQISEVDFEDWIEQRGSKFMKEWDPRYEALLETHDPGQEDQEGGLLYARYGDGIYVYAAYAFYRQLPEGVPGAYRLFANLLSLPKNPLVD